MKKVLVVIIFVVNAMVMAQAKEPQRGYRGFIEWDSTFGKADWWSSSDGIDKHNDLLFMGLSTSHGFQINRHTYVGAGFMLSLGFPCIMLPVFADFRYDVKFGKFTPYADCRLGYSISDGGGMYFSPTIGYRFNWGRKANFNIGVGLTLCGQTDEIYESKFYEGETPDESFYVVYYVGKEHKYYPRFTLRIGFDF